MYTGSSRRSKTNNALNIAVKNIAVRGDFDKIYVFTTKEYDNLHPVYLSEIPHPDEWAEWDAVSRTPPGNTKVRTHSREVRLTVSYAVKY